MHPRFSSRLEGNLTDLRRRRRHRRRSSSMGARTTNHVSKLVMNYKIYSGPCITGIIKYIPTWRGSATWRARGGHQVTKFRIILIHGRRRYGGSAYRVPDTFADTGHVSRGVRMPSAPGCRQPLEAAIRHWKRQVPDSGDQRAGETRALR